jgi:ATP-binding cassette, subfamily C, bacteriocin exporter
MFTLFLTKDNLYKPPYIYNMKKQIEKTHTLQLDQSDCGVACLLSLIQYYEGSNTLEQLRELSGTSREGTTLLGLYQAANKIGFTAEGNEADIQALIDHNQPLILHVVIENTLQHYIVCYGYNPVQKTFTIGDPAKGVYEISAEELDKIWVSKSCLTLEVNENFVKKTIQKNAQKQWFLQLIQEDVKLLWISVVLGIFVAGLGMAMAIFSQKLIDDILPSQKMNKLVAGIILLTILLLARVVLMNLREYLLLQQSKDFNNRINQQFFYNLLHLPKPFFDTRKIGELVARLNDTQRIQRVIKHLASSLVIDILVAIISLVFMYYYHWQIGIIATISLPIYFLIIYKSNQKIINAQKEVMQSYAFNESNYISSMQGIATIKNSNKQKVFAKINQLTFENFQLKLFDLGKINIRLSWQSGLASVCFLIGILVFTSIEVIQKKMQLGELMAVLGIAGSLLPAVASLALITIPINEAKIAFTRMFEFSSLEKEKSGLDFIEKINAIEIQNLNFRFAGRSLLLQNINLELKKGNLYAIVGESGSGKSTLGQILQRYYTIESGAIILDGKSIENIDLESFRNITGVIPQEINIFSGNVIDNILLGNEDTTENILEFLKTYQLDEYFNTFPQGLSTILGEEGVNLSGGQKQMIALARVLYKKPQFLILDEATAAMDRKTEFYTMSILQKIKENCIILFISHRLQTLKTYSDYIYILENKTISQSGTHEDLMQTNNFYSDYWKN